MAFTISYVIQAVNSFTPSANQIANSVQRLRDRFRALTQAVGRASERMRDMGGRMTVGITAPLGLLAGSAIKAAATLETMEVGFQSMLGSAEAAKGFVKELTDFTAKTPFQLEGVDTSAKLLLGFGVQSDKVLGVMQQLGDVAATVNRPMVEVANIFGKVKSSGKLMTGELNELSSRGIPIIGLLAKKFGKSEDIIRKAASNSEITFQHLTEAMQDMTSEGGFAFKGMENKSKTLAGVFSTFKDNVNLALGAVGAELIKVFDLKGSLATFTDLIKRMGEAFVRFSQNNPNLAKFLIIMTGVLSILGPLAVGIGILGAVFSTAFAPVTLIVLGLAALIAGGVLLVQNWDSVKESVLGLGDKFSEFLDTLGPFGAAVKTFGKILGEAFSLPLKIIDFVIEKISSIDLLGMIPEGIKAFFGFGGETPPPAAESGLATAGAANGTTDININLSDREGLVDSISSNSSGSGTPPRVGANMQ